MLSYHLRMFKPRDRKSKAWVRITLRTLKWGTLAAALLVAGVWAGGRATRCYWSTSFVYDRSEVIGISGGVVVLWEDTRVVMPGFDIDRAMLLVPGPSPFKSRSDRWPRSWFPEVRVMGTHYGHVSLPYWLPILLFASISGGLFWRDRRAARRARVGMCPSCGYSRAGLALDAVCPECGKPKA